MVLNPNYLEGGSGEEHSILNRIHILPGAIFNAMYNVLCTYVYILTHCPNMLTFFSLIDHVQNLRMFGSMYNFELIMYLENAMLKHLQIDN